ncbi:MAG: FAD-dependent monooxygenase, partial [Limisphaerales bacterium]
MEQVTLRIRAERADNLETQRQHIAKAIGMKPEAIKEWRLLKRSIDARQKIIMMQMVFEVSTHAPLEDRPNVPCKLPSPPLGSPEVVIVGCGPSGLFAAQECLRRGMRPILLERGKDVSSRRVDLAPILRKGTIPEDSNSAFG